MQKTSIHALLILFLIISACNDCDFATICGNAVGNMTNVSFNGTLTLYQTTGQTIATYPAQVSASGTETAMTFDLQTDSLTGIDTVLTMGLICNVIYDENCELRMAVIDYKSTGSYTQDTTEGLTFSFLYNGIDAVFEGSK